LTFGLFANMTTVVIWWERMREIQLKDAKARLSGVVDDAIRGEEFVITRHGHKEAVVVSWATWRRLSNVPSFGRLLAAAPLDDEDIAPRDRSRPRRAGL
jgi:antitoxin Phd